MRPVDGPDRYCRVTIVLQQRAAGVRVYNQVSARCTRTKKRGVNPTSQGAEGRLSKGGTATSRWRWPDVTDTTRLAVDGLPDCEGDTIEVILCECLRLSKSK